MISLGKARHKLERWLLGENNAPATAARSEALKEKPATGLHESYDDRFRLFMEELEAGSQEWLGRVRLINLDSVRQHVGPAWAKLRDRVELLAEKIIREEMSGRDKLLNMGGAEFLVFFADTTPEESRIRCLAIVEAIHEKLFGFEEQAGEPFRAECHVIHRDDLALEWEADRAGHGNKSSAERLGRSFRRDAELLDSTDVALSAQAVLDAIITRGVESHHVDQLAPLLVRLKHLSRSLKMLEPALVAIMKNSSAQKGVGNASSHPGATPLGTAWEDIVELISVIDVAPDYSHADLLMALGRLQRARLDRENKAGDEGYRASRSGVENADITQFEYVPVYRSISRGERIHQGIYRVDRRQPAKKGSRPGADAIGVPQQGTSTQEGLTLEHALRYLSDRKMGTRFMLMVCVHVETLRGPNSLRRLSMILRAAELRAKRRLLIEVVDYRDSDDIIGIRRAIDELRLHAHAVFLTLSHRGIHGLEKVAAGCKKSRVHAVGIDVSKFNGRETDIMEALTRIGAVGEQCAVPTYVSGIATVPVLAKAIACGVSYVCAPALRPACPAPDDVDRATLDDLYLAV